MLKIIYMVVALSIYNINLSEAVSIELSRFELNDIDATIRALHINASASMKNSVVSQGKACGQTALQCKQPNFGREIRLGDGYNIRDNSPIVGMSPWSRATLSNDANFAETDNTYVHTEYFQEKASSDRERILDISAGLSLDVWAGIVNTGGSAAYLKSAKSKSTNVRIVARYNSKTYFKSLNFPIPVDIKSFCAPDNIATHVITSVQYGANAFFTFETEVSDWENAQDVNVKMETTVKAFAVKATANSSFAKNDKSTFNRSHTQFSYFGNVNAPECASVQDLESTRSCLHYISANARKLSMPTSFTFTKINQICSSKDSLFSTLSSDMEKELVDILRGFEDNKVKLKELKEHVLGKDIDAVKALIDYVIREITKFKREHFGSKFSELIEAFRSRDVGVEAFNDILDVYHKDRLISDTNQFIKFVTGNLDFLNKRISSNHIKLNKLPGGWAKNECKSEKKNTYALTLNIIPENPESFARQFRDGNSPTPWMNDAVQSKLNDFDFYANKVPGCFVVEVKPIWKEKVVFNSYNPETREEKSSFSDFNAVKIVKPVPTKPLSRSGGCEWHSSNKWGESVECPWDNFASGACAGGRRKDCPGKNIVELKCCSFKEMKWTDDCAYKKSWHGQKMECDMNRKGMIRKTCSSGMKPNCNHQFNTADCCKAVTQVDNKPVGPRSWDDCKVSSDRWIWGTYGERLNCPDSMVIIGRCGSGAKKDCPGVHSHGILCCNIWQLE